MAQIVYYTKVYAFGSEKELEALKNCIKEVINDNEKEIAGISYDNFENGIGIAANKPSANWIRISFNHYITKNVDPSEYFAELVKMFPNIVFIGVGNWDPTLSYGGHGTDWFAASNGEMLGYGSDEVDFDDLDEYNDDDEDSDDDDEDDDDDWDDDDPFDKAAEILKNNFPELFTEWISDEDIIERVGEAGKDSSFTLGLDEIKKIGAF